MSKTVPVREFRRHLADLLDEVADRREHVTITRHGRSSAVVIPVDEHEALEETAEILSDDATLDGLGVLERDPEAGYALRGRLIGLWSYRVGVYRIMYELRDPRIVRVAAIRHRGHAYDTDPC